MKKSKVDDKLFNSEFRKVLVLRGVRLMADRDNWKRRALALEGIIKRIRVANGYGYSVNQLCAEADLLGIFNHFGKQTISRNTTKLLNSRQAGQGGQMKPLTTEQMVRKCFDRALEELNNDNGGFEAELFARAARRFVKMETEQKQERGYTPGASFEHKGVPGPRIT